MLAPLHYVLAYQSATKRPSYPQFLRKLGLHEEASLDDRILGPPLFSEASKKNSGGSPSAFSHRRPGPVDVEGDWGEGETVIDLMAEKRRRASLERGED